MSWIQRTAAHCDQCGHEWLIKAETLPTHCAACKSRQWNAGEKLGPRLAHTRKHVNCPACLAACPPYTRPARKGGRA